MMSNTCSAHTFSAAVTVRFTCPACAGQWMILDHHDPVALLINPIICPHCGSKRQTLAQDARTLTLLRTIPQGFE